MYYNLWLYLGLLQGMFCCKLVDNSTFIFKIDMLSDYMFFNSILVYQIISTFQYLTYETRYHE